jgi:hypothetical protein
MRSSGLYISKSELEIGVENIPSGLEAQVIVAVMRFLLSQ